MSRRSRTNNKDKDSKATGPPPSFPQENYPEHRAFLIRSLQRNDVDLAALTALNRSLHNAKRYIQSTCGELVLLDLGQGRLTLINDELHDSKWGEGKQGPSSPSGTSSSSYSLTPKQKELCIDFLLRMKLRRKLLNRLARRLNRLAHAMDGEDVAPPAPPKYGDLRLHIDPADVEAYVERWERQEEAKRALQQAKDHLREVEEQKIKRKLLREVYGGYQDDSNAAAASHNERGLQTSDQQPGKLSHVASPDAIGSQAPTIRPEKAVSSAAIAPASQPLALLSHDAQMALRAYDSCYERQWDPTKVSSAANFQYTLLNDVREEDHSVIKYGAGIGATNSSMSAREREAEYNRWQTALLSRIPEQATFEDLGLQNRVFFAEGRRKRALEEIEESPSKKHKSPESTNDEQECDDKTVNRKLDMDILADVVLEEEKRQCSKGDKGSSTDKDKRDIDDMEVDKSPPNGEKSTTQSSKEVVPGARNGGGNCDDVEMDPVGKNNEGEQSSVPKQEDVEDGRRDINALQDDEEGEEISSNAPVLNERQCIGASMVDDAGEGETSGCKSGQKEDDVEKIEDTEKGNDLGSVTTGDDEGKQLDSHTHEDLRHSARMDQDLPVTSLVKEELDDNKAGELELEGKTSVEGTTAASNNDRDEIVDDSNEADEMQIEDAEGYESRKITMKNVVEGSDSDVETAVQKDSSAVEEDDQIDERRTDPRSREKVEYNESDDSSSDMFADDEDDDSSQKSKKGQSDISDGNETDNMRYSSPSKTTDGAGKGVVEIPDKKVMKSQPQKGITEGDDVENPKVCKDPQAHEDKGDLKEEKPKLEELPKIKIQPRKEFLKSSANAENNQSGGVSKEDSHKKSDNDEGNSEPAKRIKVMSFAPVPTFYEQDLKRIRLIHEDLMAVSKHEHARHRLSEVTMDYNKAFRLANEIYERRQAKQQQLTNFLYDSRTKMSKLKNDYALEVAIARNRWQKKKQEHDLKRAKATLPSNWGRQPIGTNATLNYMRGPGIAAAVGSCVADLVDGAILSLEGNIQVPKFDDFVPPPAPDMNKVVNQQTGETLRQQQMRVESELRGQLNALNASFQNCEEERKRAWKKMLKTKAEFELPHSQHGQLGNAKRGQILDLNNYHLVPLPPLRASTQQMMPQEYSVARSALATYTPPKSGIVGPGGSESKYSAARVRERIGADGTVAPVSEPKKTKDGLYQRPAGRTRKGMQWDALQGIWVPEGSHQR